MTELDSLRRLYGEREVKPGDTVTVEGWPQRFGVIDVRGGRLLLQSERGIRMVVRADLVTLEREKTVA